MKGRTNKLRLVCACLALLLLAAWSAAGCRGQTNLYVPAPAEQATFAELTRGAALSQSGTYYIEGVPFGMMGDGENWNVFADLLEPLHTILDGETFYAVQKPENFWGGYDAYINSENFSQKADWESAQRMANIGFAEGGTPENPRDEQGYAMGRLLIFANSEEGPCYLLPSVTKGTGALDTYVYELRDPKACAALYQWFPTEKYERMKAEGELPLKEL